MMLTTPETSLVILCHERMWQSPPNTDQTLPVPTAVKAILAEQICGQQNPRAHTFLAELDEELRNKKKSLIITCPIKNFILVII
jgi:hypothetical protein